MADHTDVHALLPVSWYPGTIRYAAGVRASRGVFATGQKAVGDDGAMGAEVLRTELPEWDKPKLRREADRIFRNLDAVFQAGGTSLRNLVRVDQKYTSPRPWSAITTRVVPSCRTTIPPSTSTLARRFLLEAQDIEVHMIGVIPEERFTPQHVRPHAREVASELRLQHRRDGGGLMSSSPGASPTPLPSGRAWRRRPNCHRAACGRVCRCSWKRNSSSAGSWSRRLRRPDRRAADWSSARCICAISPTSRLSSSRGGGRAGGTPMSLVRRLNEAVVKSVTHPEVMKRIQSVGAEPAAFADFLSSEMKPWAPVQD